MIRSIFTAAALSLLAAPAFAGTIFTAELSSPATKSTIVVDGKVWACAGTVCSAELERKKPTVATCKKVAKEAGAVVALKTSKAALSDAELTACNGKK